MTTIKPRTVTVPLFDPDDMAEIERLRADVAVAVAAHDGPKRRGDSPTPAAAAKAYDDFVNEATERAVKVELQALPRKKWRSLVAAHPPRPDNEDDKPWGWNVESFGDEMVPASIISPALSETALEEFLDSLNDATFERIYMAAIELNRGTAPDPKADMSYRLSQISSETSK